MVGRIFTITTYGSSKWSAEAAEEWKKLGICAVGWAPIDLGKYEDREKLRRRLKEEEYPSGGIKDAWLFAKVITKGDLVLAYSRNNTIAYIGEVEGLCMYNSKNKVGDPDDFSYPNQRKVRWWDDPHHFDRRDLPKHFADQFGKRGVTVAEIIPDRKGFHGFIKIVEACPNSGSRYPGINEDAVKAGLIKYLHHSLDSLEAGLKLTSAEVTIGKQKKPRPDFLAEDREGRSVIIECKGRAGEAAVDQILGYEKEFETENGNEKPRLMIVAFIISNACRLAAKNYDIELVECDLSFRKIA